MDGGSAENAGGNFRPTAMDGGSAENAGGNFRPWLAPEARAHGLREPVCQRVDLLPILALDHDADDGLRPRRAQHDAASGPKLGLCAPNRLADGGVFGRVHGLADFDV